MVIAFGSLEMSDLMQYYFYPVMALMLNRKSNRGYPEFHFTPPFVMQITNIQHCFQRNLHGF